MNDKDTIEYLRMRLRIAEDTLTPNGTMIEGDYASLCMLQEDLRRSRELIEDGVFAVKCALRIASNLTEIRSVPIADSALQEIHERPDTLVARVDAVAERVSAWARDGSPP